MKNVSLYSPWGLPGREVHREMRQALDRLFENDESDQSNVVTSQWVPQVDIGEEDDRFVIFADVPGVDPKEIEITMENGVLTLKGQRTEQSIQKKGKLTRVERVHGIFYRRFALPDSANPNGIKATGRHGVLEISIPKRPETAPRRINVD